ncbi:MAG TPA: purine-nucleoside phosphorylase [Isosphaeraceae bacterium]
MNAGFSPFERINHAAVAILSAIPEPPRVGIILGSGLGNLADLVESPTVINYSNIPHFPRPSIEGHKGNLIVGKLGGAIVAMLQGRIHYYEGHDLAHVTFPTRVLARLGCTTLVLTAASGGVNLDFRKGDVVCVSDHINGLGLNPLRGPNDDRLGKRFPDMTEVYAKRLQELAHEQAAALGIPLKSGVYMALPGPSYETPAEIRMLRTLGADVVGMSTVPEAIVARHSGMEVLAFAMVTNAAAGVTGEAIDHAEVLDVADDAGPRLGRIIAAVLARLA